MAPVASCKAGARWSRGALGQVASRTRPMVDEPSSWKRLRSVLPEGRSIPEDQWWQRHVLITRFALLQAIGLGGFGLLRGFGVVACLLAVLLVAAPALVAGLSRASRRLRTVSATVSLMLASAVLVDLAGGLAEAHFHFFVMVGVVAAYQDLLAFGVCLVMTVAHHAIVGLLWPHVVYGTTHEISSPLLYALIQGGFVLAASLTHVFAWKANENQYLSDPLTGLPNRLAFMEILHRRLAADPDAVSVLLLGLDNFKAVNDSAGHAIGDQTLQATARRIVSAVRETDLVARLAGDEFAVLVPGPASVATQIGDRILRVLQPPTEVHGRDLLARASIGVADDSLACSREAGDLLRDATLAMHLAKSAGKNQMVIYTAGVDEAVRMRADLAADLRYALAREELEVYYQPVVSIETGSLTGVEALLRWHHPVRGLVSPAEFIPLAEQTGAIRPIGNWVLRTAVSQVAAWRQSLPSCRHLSVAVNLSPVQLSATDLPALVNGTLATTGLPAHSLTLEVTEGALLADVETARRQLDGLRALGVRVAIDDFGTGYSSLSYLVRLPVDEVKIDQSFVRDLASDPRAVVLVKAIIAMANGLGLHTLAEGVEDKRQEHILQTLGCPSAQGYLYARPLPAGELAAYALSADPARRARPPAAAAHLARRPHAAARR